MPIDRWPARLRCRSLCSQIDEPAALGRSVLAVLERTVAVAGAVLVRNSRENLLTRAQEWDYFLGIASVKRGQALLQGTLVAQGAFSVYDTTALKLVGGWPNRRGLLFYFFCYQFIMSPISLAGYSLEAVRARRAW
jgi:cellulose synthase/poly-beta-1,6-N-acetylglucosamine synthase-like glycosyltransferase